MQEIRFFQLLKCRPSSHRSCWFSILLTIAFFCCVTGLGRTSESRVVVLSSIQALSPQRNEETQFLEVGKFIEGDIQGGGKKLFLIALRSGQFLRINLSPNRFIVASLFDPDQKKIAEGESPNYRTGQDYIAVITGKDGSYRLEISSEDEPAVRGHFAVRIEKPRMAEERDRKLIAARIAQEDGATLQAKENAESRRKAIDKYLEAIPLWRAIQDPSGEAWTLYALGRVYRALGENAKALDANNQALSIFQSMGNLRMEAWTQNNIGDDYNNIGEGEKASEALKQALSLWQSIGDPAGMASTQNNLAHANDLLGDKQAALNLYQTVRSLWQSRHNLKGEATALQNIGTIYRSLGDHERALASYQQALPLFESLQDRGGEATVYNNLGYLYYDLGDYPSSLKYYETALQLRRAIGDQRTEGRTLVNIGASYDEMGEHQKALDYLNKALPMVTAVGDRKSESQALTTLGKANSALGDSVKAMEYYRRALALAQELGIRVDEANVRYWMAREGRERAHFEEARAQIEAALRIVESIRTQLVLQELRTSYRASVQQYYELYIDILMRLHEAHAGGGFDIEAFEASERSRARSLLDLLEQSQADPHQGIDPTLSKREGSLLQKLNSKTEQQLRLLSGRHTSDEVTNVNSEIQQITQDLQQVQTEIAASNSRYAALIHPQLKSLKEIQKLVLDSHTLLLEYVLGEKQSYLWAVTPESFASYRLAGRAQINEAARLVYQLLTTRMHGDSDETVAQADARLSEAARQLGQMILAPAISQLVDKRLLIVPDGALQFISFAMLPAPDVQNMTGGKRPPESLLIEKHEVINLHSASVLAREREALTKRNPPSKGILVMADPVFDAGDSRVSHRNRSAGKSLNGVSTDVAERHILEQIALRSAVQRGEHGGSLEIPRLPFTRLESHLILSQATGMDNLEALDFKANRQLATSESLQQYQFIQIAAHGYIDSESPDQSALLLSMVNEAGEPQDGFLRLKDIYHLKLSADLVVLSACQTGLGKEVKGEGLVGLTQGFLFAGAARVAVSLWSVNDKATAELMGLFYKGMLKEGKRPALAMREAQMKMWRQKRWQAPFYWAAFVLEGEWR